MYIISILCKNIKVYIRIFITNIYCYNVHIIVSRPFINLFEMLQRLHCVQYTIYHSLRDVTMFILLTIYHTFQIISKCFNISF